MSNENNEKQQEFFIKAKEKSLESLVEGKEENKKIKKLTEYLSV